MVSIQGEGPESKKIVTVTLEILFATQQDAIIAPHERYLSNCFYKLYMKYQLKKIYLHRVMFPSQYDLNLNAPERSEIREESA